MRIHRELLMALAVVLSTAAAFSAIPDRNVNMVSGTSWPGGDPFLQRQNEPSVAVSTRNPLHLLAGANDYRTVDIPGLENIKVIGDAWLGVFRSYDGGNTWTSTLLPGYPQDGSAAGMASPLKGYPAGADPVVRAGANGIFYFAGITLSREENPIGALFVARYLDYNDKESSHLANEEAHSIRYVDAKVLQKGTAGQFQDKPWMAVDVPRAGSAPCTIDGQTLEGGNVYVAWTILVGGDENIRSKMMITRSTDCGATWQQPVKLSETHSINQGASIAIDPVTGHVYVVWRRITNGRESNALLFSKSTDFGRTFSQAQLIREITPFEQGTTTLSFRTTMFPSMTVDGTGRIYVVWSERNAENRGRIALISSTNGSDWSSPMYIATGGLGHQFMPTIAFAHGKLSIAWYDQTEDHTRGIYAPISVDGKHTGQYTETRQPQGHRALGQLQHVFKDFIQEFGDGEPLQRRHTLDVFVAQADPGAMPVFQTQRASQYYFGSRPEPNELTGQYEIEQMQFNPPNLPLFRQGTTPFAGDYLDLGYAEWMTKDAAGWRFKTEPSKAPVRHVVWTDNRDVRPPADGNWRNYTPVGSPGGTSLFDGTLQSPQCVAGQAGMRNQNIYTTRVTNGLFAGSPGNTKPFLDEQGNPLQRAFVVFVQNALKEAKTYRLEIVNDPVTSAASFLQFEILKVLYVSIPPRSTIARTVFAVSGQKYDEIEVKVEEVAAPGGDPLPDGLATTVVLNPDIANPDIANPDIANPDIANPDIANAEVYNPDIANPDIANPDIANPDIANPDIANPDIANPDIANPDIANPDIANPDIANPDIANPDIANPDIANGTVTDTTWEMTNEGNTVASYSINLLLNGQVPEAFKLQLILHRIYETPIARPDCTLGTERHTVLAANINNPEFTAPGDLTSNDVADPSEKNATIYILPGETIRITLRVVDPIAGDDIVFNAAEQVTPIAVAHGVNTLDYRAGVFERSASLTIVTTRVPDAITDEPYETQLTAVGGRGQKKFKSDKTPGATNLDQSGKLSGTISLAGDYYFLALVEDSYESGPHQDDEKIHLRAVDRLVIPQQTLANGTIDTPYNATLAYTGGVAPFTWSLASGSSLPAGLSLSPAGVISGTPTAAGISTFTVELSDGTYPTPQSASRQLSLEILARPMFLEFLTQPESLVEESPAKAISVRAFDSAGTPLPGVLIELSLEDNPCQQEFSPLSSTTNETGVASFVSQQSLDACYGYSFAAAGQLVGFTPAAAESDSFDVFGFGQFANLNEGRWLHTATTLLDGRVLVTGGWTADQTGLSSAEIYDPAKGSWDSVGSMALARMSHTATLLEDGRVLIAGGRSGETYHTQLEVFDPQTDAFTQPAEAILGTGRGDHGAIRLPDGTVLLVGGQQGLAVLNTAEIYDPATDTVTPVRGVMANARSSPALVLTGNGVLVFGGGWTDGHRTVELFSADAFTAAGLLRRATMGSTATLLGDGRVLVAGGSVNSPDGPVNIDQAEVFDPAAPPDELSTTDVPMAGDRSEHLAFALQDGTVILAGGTRTTTPGFAESIDRVERFVPDLRTEFFFGFGRLSARRARPLGAAFPAGGSPSFLAVGGLGSPTTVELFYPPR